MADEPRHHDLEDDQHEEQRDPALQRPRGLRAVVAITKPISTANTAIVAATATAPSAAAMATSTSDGPAPAASFSQKVRTRSRPVSSSPSARDEVLHAVGRGDTDEVESPRDHDLGRAAEREPERLLVALEHPMLVVEAVEVVGDADGVRRDSLRAALLRGLGRDGWELGEPLDQLALLRCERAVRLGDISASPAFRRIPAVRACAY